MIKKVDLGIPSGHNVFGNPAPLGLFGLAIACAALTPIAFGYGLSAEGLNKSAFITAGIYAIFFGGFCQLLTGLMDFANKNTYGGTIFTAFAFNWFITGGAFIALAFGFMLDHTVIFATDLVMLVVFAFLTYGFGFFSKLLFLFLLDIDLLYACKILKALSGCAFFNPSIAIFTVLLGVIGLWLALAGLMNPITGRKLFPVGEAMFFKPSRESFDWSVRRSIFDCLYEYWRENGFAEMPMDKLEEKIDKERCSGKSAVATSDGTRRVQTGESVIPDVLYLAEYGALQLTLENSHPNKPLSVRLNSAGIDLYEQLILKKYDF
jgi:uncharacterized protein